jgi:hypothetical protein
VHTEPGSIGVVQVLGRCSACAACSARAAPGPLWCLDRREVMDSLES